MNVYYNEVCILCVRKWSLHFSLSNFPQKLFGHHRPPPRIPTECISNNDSIKHLWKDDISLIGTGRNAFVQTCLYPSSRTTFCSCLVSTFSFSALFHLIKTWLRVKIWFWSKVSSSSWWKCRVLRWPWMPSVDLVHSRNSYSSSWAEINQGHCLILCEKVGA